MTQSSIWGSSDPGNVKGGGQRELSNVVGPHPVGSFTGQAPPKSVPALKPLGHFIRSHVAKVEMFSSKVMNARYFVRLAFIQ